MPDTSFIFPSRENLNIEVGDSKELSFVPKVKVSAWNGETDFSVRLITPEPGSVVQNADSSIAWTGIKKDAKFFSLLPSEIYPEGALEFNVILKEKPASNILDFLLTMNNVSFHRQPPLNEQIGEDGIVTATETEAFNADNKLIAQRPENVVNSYSVYHADCPANFAGGAVYKNGKIGTIYRPKAVESGGRETWCGLNIDTETGKMSVIIPQGFLDTAIYPITVDPTFGYTTIGGTEAPFLYYALCHVAAAVVYTALTNQRIIKFSAYGKGYFCKMAAYTVPAGTPVSRLSAGVTINFTGVAGWKDSAAVLQNMSNGITYGCAAGEFSIDPNFTSLYYDTVAGNQRSAEAITTLGAVWAHSDFSTRRYSLYATYETVNITKAMLLFDN